MVALPTDLSRFAKRIKGAFQQVFVGMVGLLRSRIEGDGQKGDTKAQAVAALCVGGMVVARAMADLRLADELHEACMSIAVELGGWKDKPHTNHRLKSLDRH